MSKYSSIKSEGSNLVITKQTTNSEIAAIIKALNNKIGSRSNILEDQNFATDGSASFRLDSPPGKPTFEIQRNGPKAQGEGTTVACVCLIKEIQELLDINHDFNALQPDYNRIIWQKLKWSFENKKNANVTLADVQPILNRMTQHFTYQT